MADMSFAGLYTLPGINPARIVCALIWLVGELTPFTIRIIGATAAECVVGAVEEAANQVERWTELALPMVCLRSFSQPSLRHR
jgi:hypothetical protein